MSVAQFAALQTGVKRSFVTEKEVKAAALPEPASALAIFGGGDGIERLPQVEWLRKRAVMYGVDIDTHGFAMMDRPHANLPRVRSLLMDAALLEVHRHVGEREDADRRHLVKLARLAKSEQKVFPALRDDRYDASLRLELERVGYGWTVEAIGAA